MKIIDFIQQGNQVKFYVGADNCENYWGDDWDDAPYEHNAGQVYGNFILGYFIKTFDFDDLVREPATVYYNSNSRWTKKDMKERRVPCIAVLPSKFFDSYDDSFDTIVGNEHTIKYYFGDKVDETKENIIYLKEIKSEKLYLEITSEIDSKFMNIVVHTLGTSLKYMANDFYIYKFDEKNYKKIENLTLQKYKTYIKDLLKSINKLYKLELNIDAFDMKLTNCISYPRKENRYYICCQSSCNFDIGEVFIK